MLDKKIKVGFIGWYSPEDKKALSGTPHKMSNLLKSIGCEVTWIKVEISKKYLLYQKMLRAISKIGHKQMDCTHSVVGAMLQSKTIEMSVVRQCDVLFAPFCSEALYSLKTDKPVIYLSDATFNIMVDYYLMGLSANAVKQGNKVEQRAMDRSKAIIVSSQWAADSAIHDYHQSPSKVHVVEFGANIDDKDIILKSATIKL